MMSMVVVVSKLPTGGQMAQVRGLVQGLEAVWHGYSWRGNFEKKCCGYLRKWGRCRGLKVVKLYS